MGVCGIALPGRASDLWRADDKRARGANVDHIEVFQLLGQHRRAKRPMSADVDASKKYYECHGEAIYTSLRAQ